VVTTPGLQLLRQPAPLPTARRPVLEDNVAHPHVERKDGLLSGLGLGARRLLAKDRF